MLTNQSGWYQGCAIDNGDSVARAEGSMRRIEGGKGSGSEGVDRWRVRVGARAIT